MSRKRKSIPSSVLRLIKNDEFIKCGRKEALNIHHIKALRMLTDLVRTS